MKKVAALDFGTNSFLCLIVEGDSSGIKKIIHDSVRIVRLGQGVNETKTFHPDALKRVDQCLSEFRKIIDQHNVDNVLAMATSAARDAKNKQDFFAICEKYKIPVQIISGKDEARITYQGATAHTGNQKPTKDKTLIIDIGGGSTELIIGQDKKVLFSQSIDIGCVRLTEKMINQQPVSDNEHKLLIEKVTHEVDSALNEIKKIGIEKIISVAGTPTTLAAAELGGFDSKNIDGFVFSTEKLEFWVNKLKETSIKEKREKLKIEPGRADVLYVGAVILWTIVQRLQFSEIEVSTKGVRYGVAIEMLQ